MAESYTEFEFDEHGKTVQERTKEFLESRQRSFRMALESPEGKLALEDLKAFCRADESTFHPDPRMHAVLEGRREVWLRIQDHLKLDPELLWVKYR